MKRPISLKIFSIALGLLALMAIVSALSAWNLSRVNNEVQTLSEYYIPLEQRMAKVGNLVRDQIIHLGRLLHLQKEHAPAAQIEQEKGLFEERGAQVEHEVAVARQVVDRALASTDIRVDAVKLAILDKELPDILTAHRHLRETVAQLVQEQQEGNPRSIQVVHDTLMREKASVDKEILDITAEIQKFTRESARSAVEEERRAARWSWTITVVAFVLGLLFASVLTRNLVRPVRDLLKGTKAVEEGNLNVQIQGHSADEIGLLASSFNHMVSELRQKELIKETFGKYVDPRIVKGLIEDQRLSQEGEKGVMTVFFSDLEGFTTLSERLTPNGVVRLLNQYFTAMSEPVRAHSGIIDKYIGDALMAFWGPPFTDGNAHARLACLTALEQLIKLDEFRRMLPDILGLRKELPPINIRIGLATGDVTVGNIGSEFSKGYTVIGDTVNVAARLESANKQYGTRILISQDTWGFAKDAIEVRQVDSIRVVGKSEPVHVFELLGRKGELASSQGELRDHFEKGLESYRQRDWDQAERGFTACQQLNPADGPSALFLRRLHYLREHPPGGDWDGVWTLKEK